MSMTRTKNPEVLLTVTEDHFTRAVPGDPCHCTIGEATKDSLNRIIPALNLKEVDASTINVHPADVDGEPAVSVGFVATDNNDDEVTVRFLLEQAAAFKVAYTTDNKATGGMRRTARRNPYILAASQFKVRKRDAGVRTSTVKNGNVDPEKHIISYASGKAHVSATAEETATRTLEGLETKQKNGTLPYKLTAKLRKVAAEKAVASFENKGTKPRPTHGVKVYSNKRFYG
jgi:hypothetical protein